MSSTSSPAIAHRDRAVFSEGRQEVLRNSQQPQKGRSGEVKWDRKRRTQPMAIHASGLRPGPINLGAPLPHHRSLETRLTTRVESCSHRKEGNDEPA